jgi:ketosteroid isomerase-like protein
MYHWIVRRKIEETFGYLNQHNIDKVVGIFDPALTHSFAGESALGGVRKSVTTARLWYQRLFRLFPDIAFKVHSIVIAGLPWDTRVAVRFQVELNPPQEATFHNEVAQFLRIRWGRIIEMYLYEDTSKLDALLKRMNAVGITEAAASPITG